MGKDTLTFSWLQNPHGTPYRRHYRIPRSGTYNEILCSERNVWSHSNDTRFAISTADYPIGTRNLRQDQDRLPKHREKQYAQGQYRK